MKPTTLSRFFGIASCLILTAGCLFGQAVSSPQQLISEMHDHYAGKWYRTLTFEQRSITHKPDGTESTELWHEALWLPGRLRIDIGDPNAGNGMLFANSHLYVFKDGKLASDKPFLHPLLLLGFDVYMQPVETTMQQLKDLHFDLSIMHEEDFEGHPTYVVGAKQGDLRTLQFWIDKDHLDFVRLLEPSEKQPGSMQDIRFGDYKQVDGGGWVAEHVSVLSDGKLVFEEKYSDVKVDPPLKPDLFDASNFVQKAKGDSK